MTKDSYIKELNSDITNLTLKIYSEFPELYIHLDEMPMRLSNKDNEIGLQFQYLESLKKLYQSFQNSVEEKKSK
jgi:hypothetical protein